MLHAGFPLPLPEAPSPARPQKSPQSWARRALSRPGCSPPQAQHLTVGGSLGASFPRATSAGAPSDSRPGEAPSGRGPAPQRPSAGSPQARLHFWPRPRPPALIPSSAPGLTGSRGGPGGGSPGRVHGGRAPDCVGGERRGSPGGGGGEGRSNGGGRGGRKKGNPPPPAPPPREAGNGAALPAAAPRFSPPPGRPVSAVPAQRGEPRPSISAGLPGTRRAPERPIPTCRAAAPVLPRWLRNRDRAGQIRLFSAGRCKIGPRRFCLTRD